LILFVYV